MSDSYIQAVEKNIDAAGERTDEITRLREENARLREALRPFASINFNACLEDADSGQLWGWFSREDVRTAAAAIREMSDE